MVFYSTALTRYEKRAQGKDDRLEKWKTQDAGSATAERSSLCLKIACTQPSSNTNRFTVLSYQIEDKEQRQYELKGSGPQVSH